MKIDADEIGFTAERRKQVEFLSLLRALKKVLFS